MGKKEVKGSDSRLIGSVVCVGAGLLLITDGLTMTAGTWAVPVGFLFVCFGVWRLWKLATSTTNRG